MELYQESTRQLKRYWDIYKKQKIYIFCQSFNYHNYCSIWNEHKEKFAKMFIKLFQYATTCYFIFESTSPLPMTHGREPFDRTEHDYN